ncbi:Methylated-DNA-(protein)-cysteine S-methyltransferase (fragment) [Candidatus Methylobacter favarea]|uniref:Methylated-DNA-(Protein)-cysteine S-methyltransferase n=1 Tax=Candidatus Methylobacter favarea TaxID=2707345 RepID=A0A8S0WGF6_9GAMM
MQHSEVIGAQEHHLLQQLNQYWLHKDKTITINLLEQGVVTEIPFGPNFVKFPLAKQ